jgi:hypothetical protein
MKRHSRRNHPLPQTCLTARRPRTPKAAGAQDGTGGTHIPDLLAHYEVAEAARERLAPGPLCDALTAEHDAYKVGAQGPDLFFYSHVWPWQRSRADLSTLTHQHHMDDVFRAMLTRAAQAPPAERAVMLAFTCGYAAHLCLDAHAHPWVLYWTGDISGGTTSIEGALAMRRHSVLEASIDVTLQRRRSSGCGWIRRARLLDMSPAQRAVTGSLLSHTLREVYGVTFTPDEGSAALRDMALVYGPMTDPHSALSRLIRVVAPVADHRGIMQTQIFPEAAHASATCLLDERRPWSHPSAPGATCTTTFAEICETAAAETTRFLEAAQQAVFGEGDAEQALAVIGDRNMITVLPCEDPRRLVAFAPERDALWGPACSA